MQFLNIAQSYMLWQDILVPAAMKSTMPSFFILLYFITILNIVGMAVKLKTFAENRQCSLC